MEGQARARSRNVVPMTSSLPLDLTSDAVFDHVRLSDNELVGYIAMTDDGDFVHFDLLHRQAGPAGDLGEAEHTLEAIGLTLLAFATIRAYRGHFTAKEHRGVEVPGIYWHFVDVMWIIVYFTIYIL